MKLSHVIILSVGLALLAACSGPSDFEQGKKYFDEGNYQLAIEHLEKAKKANDNFVQSEELLAKAKEKSEEKQDQDCKDRAENYVKMLEEQRTPHQWDKLIQELKEFRCRGVDVKPYVERAYLYYLNYLTYYDHIAAALERWCKIEECPEYTVRTWVIEADVETMGEDGKVKEIVQQKEFKIATNAAAMKMLNWLTVKEIKNARNYSRYANNLYRWRRYAESKEAYENILTIEKLPFQVKQESEVALEELAKLVRGKGKPPSFGGIDDARYFWAEEAPKKSKIKGLLSEKPKEEEKKEEAEAPAPTPAP